MQGCRVVIEELNQRKVATPAIFKGLRQEQSSISKTEKPDKVVWKTVKERIEVIASEQEPGECDILKWDMRPNS